MKKYNIIYADPPWSYRDKSCDGACENHYKTMTIQDICELPVNDLTADHCILFLWTTYPMLQEAMKVMESWGFQYKSIGFQWIKLNRKALTPFYGLGRWTRGNTEPCLIATKGKPKRITKDVFQLIQETIGVHSKKPAKVRKEIVRLMGDLPRIELFARKADLLFDAEGFEGWDVWGNEVESDVKL